MVLSEFSVVSSLPRVWPVRIFGRIVLTWWWSVWNLESHSHPERRSAPDFGHAIIFQKWSAPIFRQMTGPVGRPVRVLIRYDIIAGISLVDAGQVAVTKNSGLRKLTLKFVNQW